MQKIYLYEMKDEAMLNPIMLSKPEEMIKYNYCNKIVVWDEDKETLRKITQYFTSEGCTLMVIHMYVGYGINNKRYCVIKYARVNTLNVIALDKIKNCFE